MGHGVRHASADRTVASPVRARPPEVPRALRGTRVDEVAPRQPSGSARGGSTAAACEAPPRRGSRPSSPICRAAGRPPCRCSRGRSAAALPARAGSAGRAPASTARGPRRRMRRARSPASRGENTASPSCTRRIASSSSSGVMRLGDVAAGAGADDADHVVRGVRDRQREELGVRAASAQPSIIARPPPSGRWTSSSTTSGTGARIAATASSTSPHRRRLARRHRARRAHRRGRARGRRRRRRDTRGGVGLAVRSLAGVPGRRSATSVPPPGAVRTGACRRAAPCGR